MKLVLAPNTVLKQRAEDWNFDVDTDAAELEVDMVMTMVTSKGIGLAANQVGILKRVFAIKLTDQVPFCMFNPVIIKHETELEDESEGCLSFPNLFLKVKRYSSITAEYFDRQGKKRIIELEGLDARCFQHELDHLDGVCFTDVISPLKLAMAVKKQRKLNGRTK